MVPSPTLPDFGDAMAVYMDEKDWLYCIGIVASPPPARVVVTYTVVGEGVIEVDDVLDVPTVTVILSMAAEELVSSLSCLHPNCITYQLQSPKGLR